MSNNPFAYVLNPAKSALLTLFALIAIIYHLTMASYYFIKRKLIK